MVLRLHGELNGKYGPPLVPASCAECPIGPRTICRPLVQQWPAIMERLKAGHRIIRSRRELFIQGEFSPDLFVILDGWVMLHMVLETGARQIIDFVLPGALIGYQNNPTAPMRHTAESLTPVSVCVIRRRDFNEFLREHDAFARRLNEILAIDLERARMTIVNLGSRRAFASLANLLVTLYLRSREASAETVSPGTAFIPITQEQLAFSIGTSNVHVSNLLKQMRIKNLIEFHTPYLKVMDYDGLLAAASYESEF